MLKYDNFELARASRKIVADLLDLRPGENLLVLADTIADKTLVDATALAAYVAGGIPTVALYPTPMDVIEEPPKPVAEAMKGADAIIEYSVMYLAYTKAFEDALASGVRYLCYTGLNAMSAIESIGQVSLPKVEEFASKFHEIFRGVKSVRVTNRAGSDVTFEPQKPRIFRTGPPRKGEYRSPPGEIGGWPVLGSVNGTAVFDGALFPPKELGILKTPIELIIKDGKVVEIKGAEEARILKDWLKAIDDPEMDYPAHIAFGFNPVRKLCGCTVIDERIFGCCEMGMGMWSWSPDGKEDHHKRGKRHYDGVMMNASVWFDGELIEKDGRFINPELARIQRELGIA